MVVILLSASSGGPGLFSRLSRYEAQGFIQKPAHSTFHGKLAISRVLVAKSGFFLKLPGVKYG
jgi:hypothetical protein